jgi:hypothetical protein
VDKGTSEAREGRWMTSQKSNQGGHLPPNNSVDRSGGSVLRKITGPAMLE